MTTYTEVPLKHGQFSPNSYHRHDNRGLYMVAITVQKINEHSYSCESGPLRYVFAVKLTFEMITVHGQKHSFLTHERMFLSSIFASPVAPFTNIV